jgi:hypothetical protein
MNRFIAFASAAVTICVLAAASIRIAHASPQAGGDASPIFGIKLPARFRDWKVVGVAHEAGKNNDLRVVLGNDIAIKAFRDGKLPYPDGAIIARLAWRYTPSEANNQSFGDAQRGLPERLSTRKLMPRTRESMPRRAVGDSRNSRAASLTRPRRCKPATLATD